MREIIKRILHEKVGEITEYTRWTPEMVASIAKQYETKVDFLKGNQPAYTWAQRNGLLDKITSHMKVLRKKWTKDMVHDEALKYQTRSQFALGSSKAYDMAQKYGWLDDVTKHMKQVLTYWTKEMAQEEAFKYTTRKDFVEGSPRAYSAAQHHGWLDDITKHMEYLGNMYVRIVYAFEFPDNSVYVGLTLNKKQREKQHTKIDEKTNSAVSEHIKKTGLIPTMKEISDGYLPSDEAQRLEDCTIKSYKDSGWFVLNKRKAGALGFCDRKWTYDTVKNDALKYKTRTEWHDNSTSYRVASSNGWLEELSRHMQPVNYHRWTYDEVKDIAQKYNKRTDFQKNDGAAYQWASKNGFLDDITTHMQKNFTISLEMVYDEGKKYKTRTEFKKNSPGAYKKALELDIIDDVMKHAKPKQKTISWTDELMYHNMSNYDSITTLRKKDPKTFSHAVNTIGYQKIKDYYSGNR